MSADQPRAFVDANVLVYAFDTSAGPKQEIAEQLLIDLWETDTGCLSVQVLQEFFVTVTRKVARPLSVDDAAERIRELSAWRVFAPDADDVLAAISLHRKSAIGFWDAMIVHAAAESGCDVLWTEDLNDGQALRGVRIRNPFFTAMSDGFKNYISPAGYRRLQDEMARLWKVERPEMVATVAWAAGNGDRSENGDYIYGKKRLREIDRRLRYLSKSLDRAVIVDNAGKAHERVFFGATVSYQRESGEEREVTIVGIDELDSGSTRVSWRSPLANALLKAKVGDVVTLRTPQGHERLEVLDIRYDRVE